MHIILVGVSLANHVMQDQTCVEIFTQEQYWRIPADTTPAQLDEAILAIQPSDCHDNNINQSEDNEEPTVQEEEEENDTLNTIVEEPRVEDVTPPYEDTIADNDDNGVQSDSSEHSGLCIDYHSDSATEGTLCYYHTTVVY